MWLYVVLVIVGLILWLNNLGFEVINFGRDWPLLLVLVGIWGIVENYMKQNRRKKTVKRPSSGSGKSPSPEGAGTSD